MEGEYMGEFWCAFGVLLVWFVHLCLSNHYLIWYGHEVFSGIQKINLFWRNETFWYHMKDPKFNFTILDVYDVWNKTRYNSQQAVLNLGLSLLSRLYKGASNLTTSIFGQEVANKLFSERVLVGLTVWNFPEYFQSTRNSTSAIQPGISNLPMDDTFSAFATTFHKNYSQEEKDHRQNNFRENLKLIAKLNTAKIGTATFAVTPYTDFSQTEFQRKYCTYHSTYDGRAFYSDEETINVGPTPEQFDWKTRGLVSKVKNNENCGGGWAYAVVDCLEMHNAIRRNASVVEYSAQQIVDCDKNSRGCAGGSVTNAYKYIKDAGGLALERSYPYTFRESSCLFEPSMAKIRIKSTFYTLPPSEETIRHFIYNYGPVVAAINCAQLQFYKRGVIRCNDENCNPRHMNHAVVVVGYGVEGSRGANSTSGIPYWLVKNSWGTAWGEEGYFKVFRGKRENTLGIQNFLTAPMVDVDSFEGKGKW
ncbi:unnamed protein product [Bemisia tabaci]|uniref:Uncharacterized protein n=1 Tax=Bemisia tabaci TaxID=7038 RepID=A0A9P0AL83_BEMTA|nr:unnamed protein product [Bemisia tabaci]